MRHNIQVEEFGLRLRPVSFEDAAFIVWLRNMKYVKGMVGDSAPDQASQESWLKAYFEREGDYYFISETLAGIPLGTHGIYGVKGNTAEKGRHIMRPEVLAGVPTALLATDLAFGRLGLLELSATCVSSNIAVLSLHRKTGFKEAGIIPSAQIINGLAVDLVKFTLTVEDWTKVRGRLLPFARLAEAQVLQWAKSQLGERQPWE